MTELLPLAPLKQAASDPAGFTWKRCGPEVLLLLEVVYAAQSVFLGLTSPEDPMDVDERINRLGAALLPFDWSQRGN